MDALMKSLHSGRGYAMEFDPVRRTPRYPLFINIEVTDVRSNIQIKGQTKELSLFGCSLESFNHFAKGTNVAIMLSHRREDVKAFARVIYANADLGMGFAFTRIEREDERILKWWITEFASNPM
jgi:hypothetical protein